MDRTFVMVKPDGVARGLTGHIVSRFEEKGFKLAAAKLMQLDRMVAEEHYDHLRSKVFFDELVDFITSGPVFAMVLEGKDAVKNARSLIGATNPSDALPGTIRGDYAIDVASNIIHGSDSEDNAEREINLYFH
ncbi:nucleoside-diphosphate kinase [Paenibacillus agaridevorans]|uniref:Nucleoside diphosphate kinase n=1 Tax=Paenibacillus agaridevorans TaxID=171404 RepID=A0A2R5EJC1_9BACL|nr:nucleoside-diphosphate kinase [Paenibacillus agaridevorans]GBG06716.1 nucleoside-diphosphate kinase [Paenibacillus agaridevorans]